MSDKKSISVDFTGVEEAKSKYETYLTPGVYELTITGLEFGTTANNPKPYMDVTVVAAEGKHTSRFYFTEASLPRLKHLMVNCGVSEDAMSGKLTAMQLEKMLIGKKFRGLLSGEERLKNGVKVVYAGFSWTDFAQPLTAVPFVFNEKKNVKRIKSDDSNSTTPDMDTETMVAPSTNSDDLPF